jgi:hypothetical protein
VPRQKPEFVGPLALVVGAALVLQASALERPFFADDYLFLDLVRRHPGLAALTAPDAIGNYFRPLSRAGYFALLTPLSAGSSALFHVVNLALLAAVLVLFARVARRMLAGDDDAGAAAGAATGAAAGAVAGAAFLALHYAFDVPVGWVSGSQDLLALGLGLLALALTVEARAWWGALALLGALLCKESVAPAALVAAALVYARTGSGREAVRRAAPLALATALWGGAWLALRATGKGAHVGLQATGADALAALVHGGQVALGLEIAEKKPLHVFGASWAALGLAALAMLWATRRGKGARRGAKRGGPSRARVALVGLAWFLVAALATAPVAPLWSAYYYSFALCGAALALAALVANRPPAIAVLCVLVPGFLCAQASGIGQFAAKEGRWIVVSHVDRAYLDRGMRLLTRLTNELKAARPSVPPRTTFVFSGVPSFTGFQVGDGPFVRWAYADTTLRSRFLSGFSRADVDRGPVLYLSEYNGHLEDRSGASMFALLGTELIIGEHKDQATVAFRASMEKEPVAAPLAALWLQWLTAPPPRPEAHDPVATAALQQSQAGLARGDTAGVFAQLVTLTRRYPGDERLHALAADVLAEQQPNNSYTILQAYAARTLDGDNPRAWRRWAFLVAGLNDDASSLRAIANWKRLAGAAAGSDVAMGALERALRAHEPTQAIVLAGLKAPP